MYIIRPVTIADANLFGSNVPETDGTQGEYSAGTTYADGDTVRVTTGGVHKVYESLQNANTGHAVTDTDWWLDTGATNRWKCFDAKVGTQSTRSESLTHVLKPGRADSLALLNLDATEAQIVVSDSSSDLVSNGTAWTGASGTTQPTGWDKVGTPSDFTIDTGALKITSDAAGEGISQTIAVTAGTEMQLLGKYKNTAGDVAQYAIYDVTHGADIVAAADLDSSTVDSVFSSVFTVPAGCTSVKISLLAKNSGDIVWFDSVSLLEVNYNSTTDLTSTIAVVDWYTYFFEPIVMATDLVKTDLATIALPFLDSVVTVTVSNPGGTAKVGELVVGLKFDIGGLHHGAENSMTDYSTKSTDAFGNFTITTRDYAKNIGGDVEIKNTLRDEVARQFNAYRTTPLVWVGHENYTSLIVYGFLSYYKMVWETESHSIYSFEVTGLT